MRANIPMSVGVVITNVMNGRMAVVEIELLVLVNEDGEWEIGVDDGDLKTRYEENVGELNAGAATRLVRVKLKVPTPRPVEVEAEIADQPDGVELKVA
jgi:hypothetical protein